VYHQVTVGDETIIPVLNGAALVRSTSNPGAWRAVRLDWCDCQPFAKNRHCRHVEALARYLGVDDDDPTFAEWVERRHQEEVLR
jgi:hypothetical protein